MAAPYSPGVSAADSLKLTASLGGTHLITRVYNRVDHRMNRITLYTPLRNPGKAGVMNVSGWMNLIISRNTSFLQQVKTINASFVTMLDTRELLFESANSTVNRK